jgi:HEAT repeat protein
MMSESGKTSNKRSLLLALVGVALSCTIAFLIVYQVNQNQRIQSMNDTIRTLKSSLEEKQRELESIRSRSRESKEAMAKTAEQEKSTSGGREPTAGGQVAPGSATGSLQILKDLEDDSDTDPRSSAEKLQELLSDSVSEEEAAIASRFIFDKARDPQALPDYSLQAIYASQTNPDLKRVIAQVLSQRGNDALLNSLIADAQARLKSAQPRDRLDALSQLGKTRSTHAVDAIAPSLQDPDTTVRLAALFALRDTGNQRHAGLAESMIRDPDPSVSSLAGDVSSSLRNLSSSARTGYSRSDIEAELPPIANP